MKRSNVLFGLIVWLLAALSFASSPAGAADRVALVIGNATYPHDERALAQPIKDARAIAKELRRAGFEVITGEDLTRQKLRAALRDFKSKIKPGSAALFFFSGYGVQTGKRSYVIPVDAQIWTEGEVKRDGISIDSILSAMDSAGATVKLVIIDAARRNPFERRFRGTSIGLSALTAPAGTLAMYSAAPDRVLYDTSGENSLFVTEFLKEMRPGVSAQRIFNNTQKGVSQASKNERVPWVSSSLVEDFYFEKPPVVATRPERPRDEPAPKRDEPPPKRDDLPPATRYEPPPARDDPPPPKRDDPPPAARYEPAPPRDDPPPPPRVEETTRYEPPPVKRDRVIRDLDRQIDRNPRDADAYYKRGQQWAMRRQYALASDDFGEAIRLNPKDAESFNNRCFTRAVIGELEAALDDCNEAIRLRPDYTDAFDSRGFTYLKLGRYRRAIADFSRALKANPDMASALYGRGKAKVKNGDRRGGNADIRAAKRIDSTIDREYEDYGVR